MPSLYEMFAGKKNLTSISYALPTDIVGDRSVEQELMKIDATININHASSIVLTEHPVEDGADIADHFIKKPILLDIEGVISDNPITINSALVGNVAGLGGSLLGGVAGSVATGAISAIGSALLSSGKGQRSLSYFQTFTLLQDNAILLTINSGFVVYSNMVLTDFTVPRNKSTQGGLRFTGKFKKVYIVQSEVTKVPKNSITKKARNSGAQKQNVGSKTTKDGADVAKSGRKSLLWRAVN